MKLKTIIAIALLPLFFNGCSQKELIVEKPYYICNEQKILKKVELLRIDISKYDLEYFEAKRDALYKQIDFYIEQVNSNNEICKKFKNTKMKDKE